MMTRKVLWEVTQGDGVVTCCESNIAGKKRLTAKDQGKGVVAMHDCRLKLLLACCAAPQHKHGSASVLILGQERNKHHII
eukprot:1140841-Pelagomonas_calceolata.AAC.3